MIERAAVVRAELRAVPPQKRRRVGPQVDRHVEDRPARAAHELRLAVRRGLVVHAAQRPALRVERRVALDDCRASRPWPRRLVASKVRANQPRSSLQRDRARPPRRPGSGVSTSSSRRCASSGQRAANSPAPVADVARAARMISSLRFHGRIRTTSGWSSRERLGRRIGMWVPGRSWPCLCGLRSTV